MSLPEMSLNRARSEELSLKTSDEKINQILESLEVGKKSILVVEDDKVFSSLVAEAAKSYGYQVLEISSGEVALEVLRRHTPSAIMLDIKLPGISGVGILEAIKQMPNLRHVPVHIISAFDYEQSTMRMGAVGYLGKPVTLEKLRDALSHIEQLSAKKPKKVLVIEDDENQRVAITQLIGGNDVEIVTMATGKAALDYMKSHVSDCIVLDLNLPDMTGGDFLGQVNSFSEIHTPVIVYTGKDLSREEEEYLRKYSDSIIIKGVRSPERLLDEVNLFLHRVEGDLPQSQQKMLTEMRHKDEFFTGRSVLLVDDDLRNVFALTSVLEGKGLQVLIARDGMEALEKVASHPEIDIILMDIMMPRMDGLEATRRIRQMKGHKGTPIVALTAKAMKGDHEKVLESGANDYLPKPINLDNLFSVMRVWLRGKDPLL